MPSLSMYMVFGSNKSNWTASVPMVLVEHMQGNISLQMNSTSHANLMVFGVIGVSHYSVFEASPLCKLNYGTY